MIYGIAAIFIYFVSVYCFVRIMQKAGFGYWGLMALFPPLIPVLVLILAFHEWPVSRWPDIHMPS
jgi:drug/metabolite transporter (DMT)-like permease